MARSKIARWSFPRPGQMDIVVDVKVVGHEDPSDVANVEYQVTDPELGVFTEPSLSQLAQSIQAAIDSAATVTWEPRIAFTVTHRSDSHVSIMIVDHVVHDRAIVNGRSLVRIDGLVLDGSIEDHVASEAVEVWDVPDTPANRNKINALQTRMSNEAAQLRNVVDAGGGPPQ